MPGLVQLQGEREPVERILDRIGGGGTAVVALSGGVDSGVVAWLAHRALGAAATAVTLTGTAVSLSEHREAIEVARAVGIPLVTLAADPIARSEYRANPADRCFYCREVESAELVRYGVAHGARQYLDGVHVDDLGDDRPGLRAMDAAGFRHPLAEAGWTKHDVRAFAREVGLPNWDRPSNACLASRVEHGLTISPELLGRIDRAEELVRAEGFRQVRFRVGPRGARLEVGPEEVGRLLEPRRATDLTARLKALGFADLELDPRGYHPAPER